MAENDAKDDIIFCAIDSSRQHIASSMCAGACVDVKAESRTLFCVASYVWGCVHRPKFYTILWSVRSLRRRYIYVVQSREFGKGEGEVRFYILKKGEGIDVPKGGF